MNIDAVYDQYNTPPNLRLHQLRVAAVAKLICNGLTDFDQTDIVIITCLLHDMGNLAKFKMDQEESWMLPEGLSHWQDKKSNFVSTYGPDDHMATLRIMQAVGVPSSCITLLELMPEASKNLYEFSNLPLMICVHSDQRVNPEGIVTLEQRAEYLSARYEKYSDKSKYLPRRIELQQYLQQHCSLDLDSISDLTAAPIIDSLKSYKIK